MDFFSKFFVKRTLHNILIYIYRTQAYNVLRYSMVFQIHKSERGKSLTKFISELLESFGVHFVYWHRQRIWRQIYYGYSRHFFQAVSTDSLLLKERYEMSYLNFYDFITINDNEIPVVTSIHSLTLHTYPSKHVGCML